MSTYKRGRLTLRRHLTNPDPKVLDLVAVESIEPVFIGFDDEQDMLVQFSQESEVNLDGHRVLFAYYSNEQHSGSAFVLLYKDGKLYEVNDGHCSCNGLDNWSPEETFVASLRNMRENNSIFEDEGKDAGEQFGKLLDTLQSIAIFRV